MVAMISVDNFLFLNFLGPTCHLENARIGAFGCTVPPDSKDTEFGGSNQEASSSAGKNIRAVLVPCLSMEVRPYSYFLWCGHFRCPWVSFVTTDEFSVRVTKITSKIAVSLTCSVPFLF